MRSIPFIYGALASTLLTTGGHAQVMARPAQAPRAAIAPRAPHVDEVRAYGIEDDEGDRAVLGVSTSGGGRSDTIGILVASITGGGPADKAGLEEGDRIAAINGVSLRMAPGDVDDPAIVGVLQRRLQREMRKVKAGDEVSLRIYADGQYKDVKVKTIAADDLPGSMRLTRSDLANRAVLGIELGSRRSKRDTLGVLISSIEDGGPADKAGLLEGNRIASINGTDLRVAKEDVADSDDDGMVWFGGNASRFTRAMHKVKPGDVVELRVYTDGQYKTVKVTAGKSSDVYKGRGVGLLTPEADGGSFRIAPMGALEPGMQRLRQSLEQLRDMRIDVPRMRFDWNSDDEPMTLQMRRDGGAGGSMRILTGPGMRMESAPGAWTVATPVIAGMGGGHFAFGDGALFGVNGLNLAEVNADLAEYFGPESKDGALVVSAGKRWDGLKAGDVILSINGKSVKTDDGIRARFDSDEDTTLEIIRHGKKQSLTIKAP